MGKKKYFNPDGSENNKALGAKKYHRKQRNININKEVRYASDFNDTSIGKRLKDKHDKAYIDYFESGGENSKSEKKFLQTESVYLQKSGEYVANKLLDDIGEHKFRNYVTNGKASNKSTKQLVGDYIEQYRYVHAS